MRELDTIQKQNKVNDVFAMDEPGPSGACHTYNVGSHGIWFVDPVDKCLSTEPHIDKDPFIAMIQFQRGPRNDPHYKPGVTDVDLLEIVRDRLKCFQSGPYSCDETGIALLHVEVALDALNRRQLERAERGVLGTDTV